MDRLVLRRNRIAQREAYLGHRHDADRSVGFDDGAGSIGIGGPRGEIQDDLAVFSDSGLEEWVGRQHERNEGVVDSYARSGRSYLAESYLDVGRGAVLDTSFENGFYRSFHLFGFGPF